MQYHSLLRDRMYTPSKALFIELQFANIIDVASKSVVQMSEFIFLLVTADAQGTMWAFSPGKTLAWCSGRHSATLHSNCRLWCRCGLWTSFVFFCFRRFLLPGPGRHGYKVKSKGSDKHNTSLETTTWLPRATLPNVNPGDTSIRCEDGWRVW